VTNLSMIPVRNVTSIDKMSGEDLTDLNLLRDMAIDAENYLFSFPWCDAVLEHYFGAGVGGIVAVFFFKIRPNRRQIDEWLWVVVGDLPSAYFVIDECKTPSQVLSLYISHLKQWVELALIGRRSEHVIPVNVAPTPERAKEIERRMQFLQASILPRFQENEV
jgi:hypothetical protein